MAVEKLTLAQIREMTDVELRQKIAELQTERLGLRFKAGTEVLANPMDLRTARRTVARLKTVLAERAAQKAAGR
jgi:large subunit ribosomal protein L29